MGRSNQFAALFVFVSLTTACAWTTGPASGAPAQVTPGRPVPPGSAGSACSPRRLGTTDPHAMALCQVLRHRY
ncbi:MAG: hypothetical protein HY904_14155 [Deltaproteobacteria bacterium]|nr:hypothetical protein [Deltaproteobacteria bacterium]